jgi:murein DD-endopeptidase MepM/ murein hydrolase activator NlpD
MILVSGLYIKRKLFFLITGICAATFLLWAVPTLRILPFGIYAFFKPMPAALSVPVEGVRPNQITDSWNSLRSGGRRHQGVDIFAPRNRNIRTPLAGVIGFLGQNSLGGNVVWLIGPRGYYHYFAHLEKFGDVRIGQWVQAGHIMGTVGDSGNAKGTPTHLHYGIYTFFGKAINPFLLFSSP